MKEKQNQKLFSSEQTPSSAPSLLPVPFSAPSLCNLVLQGLKRTLCSFIMCHLGPCRYCVISRDSGNISPVFSPKRSCYLLKQQDAWCWQRRYLFKLPGATGPELIWKETPMSRYMICQEDKKISPRFALQALLQKLCLQKSKRKCPHPPFRTGQNLGQLYFNSTIKSTWLSILADLDFDNDIIKTMKKENHRVQCRQIFLLWLRIQIFLPSSVLP